VNRTRLYVAGPMTGYPQFNYPTFMEAAADLAAEGFVVENPAENPEQSSWLNYMRLSLRQISRVDGIAVLPGWELSRGAVLEVHVAHTLGLPVLTVDQWLAGHAVVAGVP
jgi:hypothetical protein